MKKEDEGEVALGKHFLKVESGDDSISGLARLGAEQASPSG